MERSDARLAQRAIREGWPVAEDVRADVVEMAIACVRDPLASPNRRIAAARLLVLADTVNVRREAIASEEHRAEISASTSVLRAALQTPAAREALAQLAAEMPALPEPFTGEPSPGEPSTSTPSTDVPSTPD